MIKRKQQQLEKYGSVVASNSKKGEHDDDHHEEEEEEGEQNEQAKYFIHQLAFIFFLINLYFKGGFRLLAKDRRRCGNYHRIERKETPRMT